MSAAQSSSVDTVQLRQVLEQRLGRVIRELRRQPSTHSSTFVLEDLWVRLQDGPELNLILKELSRLGAVLASEGIKPDFVGDPLREILMYRHVLTGRLDTAICYAAIVDCSGQRGWLVLERVPGVELYQVGEPEVWRAVACWLAEFHVWGLGKAEMAASAARVQPHTKWFYQQWMQRALAHAANASTLNALRCLANKHEYIVKRLLTLPQTLIHGEFYASNILVQMANPPRICPVDWETAALGPGLMDLAALTSGRWSAAERQELAASYLGALQSNAYDALDRSSFYEGLLCCQFQLAIQWLGWSRNWHPPAEHQTDWLGEARAAAVALGL